MIDLSQAISSEPDRGQVKLDDPKKEHSPYMQERPAKGKAHIVMAWLALFLGLIFAGMGVLLFLGANGLTPYIKGEISWGYAILLNIMILPWWPTFIWGGLCEIWLRKKLSKNRLLNPKSPWFWDYPWKPDGISDDRMQQIFHRAFVVNLLTVFLGLVTWMGFSLAFGSQGFQILFVLLVFIPFYIFWHQDVKLVISSVLSIRKYKISKIRFEEFPFFLGNRIKAKMFDLPKTFSRMTLNLRFIEETIYGEGPTQFLQYYKETKVFEKSPLVWDGVLDIEWKLPDNSEFITTLSQQPAKYWELEVKAETTGLDYHCRFLLPVYKPNS